MKLCRWYGMLILLLLIGNFTWGQATPVKRVVIHAGRLLDVKSGRMPGVSETQLRAFDISHDIKTGREHGGVGLLENDGESAIDPRE